MEKYWIENKCGSCSVDNWYYLGDPDDLTQDDIEGTECYSCGFRETFNAGVVMLKAKESSGWMIKGNEYEVTKDYGSYVVIIVNEWGMRQPFLKERFEEQVDDVDYILGKRNENES